MASTSKSHTDRERTTALNTRKSRFLRLPGETRNRIYHYALKGDVYIRACSPGHHSTQERKNCPALLASCRQIQQETVLLSYQKFTIHFAPWRFWAFCLALSSTEHLSSVKCQAIRRIDVGEIEID
ncbi:hypothetical protein G6011_07385 [Alternaria panax]|uniref:2EXR domain-containing protein n=1 Tax=Alternaria panax TaxID=48097 RepID=A0AAD4FEQ6_9PLEO|nr:hypothetical protein G6011_07385 [Alternaria panax]